MPDKILQRAKLEIRGHVQGVNFRGTVKHLAYPLQLKGYVLNDPEDSELVRMEIEGEGESIDRLIEYFSDLKMMIPEEGKLVPPRSLIHVESVKDEREEIPMRTFTRFEAPKPKTQDGKLDEIIDKLDYGSHVYKAFHDDHNQNFFTLRENFGSIRQVGESIDKKLGELSKLVDILEPIAAFVKKRFGIPDDD